MTEEQTPAQLVEEIRGEQRRCWQAGERVSAESQTKRNPLFRTLVLRIRSFLQKRFRISNFGFRISFALALLDLWTCLAVITIIEPAGAAMAGRWPSLIPVTIRPFS